MASEVLFDFERLSAEELVTLRKPIAGVPEHAPSRPFWDSLAAHLKIEHERRTSEPASRSGLLLWLPLRRMSDLGLLEAQEMLWRSIPILGQAPAAGRAIALVFLIGVEIRDEIERRESRRGAQPLN